MNKRFIAAALFSMLALSSFGTVQPGQVEVLQVVVGVAAFVALWIAVYLFVSRSHKKTARRRF